MKEKVEFHTGPDEQQRCCTQLLGQRCPNKAVFWVGTNGIDDYTHVCLDCLKEVRNPGDTVRLLDDESTLVCPLPETTYIPPHGPFLKKVKMQDGRGQCTYEPPLVDAVINLYEIVMVYPTESRGTGPFVFIQFKGGISAICQGKPEDFAFSEPTIRKV